ncbi:RsmF rRNA methyltransferase first C-terminal domain-containing protein [Leuconostocaceae bacterium ESL0723]|nr:RsmF rRNA methyltransferase first C-terminal domain-containing protein [Leuconostocaceae bacterium ESL0723]
MVTLPQSFIDKYQDLLGDQAPAFLASFNDQAERGFRINPLKTQQKLAEGDLAQAPKAPYSQWGRLGGVNGHSADHVSGLVYSQEPSAQLVGTVVAPKPGEKILDLAAAPGGKTTHLASFMQGQGLLWTNEIFLTRAKILSENVERFGITNAVVSSATPDQLAEQLPDFFDRVLVDAPCSGEGMFRKDPDAVQYWNPDYPLECSLRQKEIMAAAVKMVRPGGYLIYSTCTFAPEEDEQVIDWLVKTYPDFEIDAIQKDADGVISNGRPEWTADNNPDLAKTARLWPQQGAGEGHFVARLKRQEEGQPATVKPAQEKVQWTAQEKADWQTFVEETLTDVSWDTKRLVRQGDRLMLAPAELPATKQIKILRLGLVLGRFKKGRFEPDHALALALHPDQVQQRFALDEAQFAQYVHGDVINLSDTELKKGWVLVQANGNGIGWAKYVNGQLKNFYPKGLRFGL